MTNYATEIAETLADLEEDGGPIVFTAKSAGRVYDEDTGLWIEGVDAVTSSSALQLEDDPAMFAALGLTLRSPVTLMVAAAPLTYPPKPTYNGVPVRFAWAGDSYAVRSAEPLAPDGTPIYYTVIGDA